MPLVLLAALALSLAGSLVATSIGRSRGVVALGRLAQGFLFGTAFAGATAAVCESRAMTGYVWPLALVVAALAAFGAWREWLRFRHAAADRAHRGVVAAALAIAAIGVFAAFEVNDRPTFPWDAWTTWIFRAKAMFLVPGAAFSEMSDGSAYEAAAAGYPNAIGGLLTWLARLAGGWNETALLALWPVAYVAVGYVVLAVADAIAPSRRAAVFATALFATAPLVVTHALLAGYMDLWTAGAVTLLAAFVARRAADVQPLDVPAGSDRWLVARDLAVLALPLFFKREGLVWGAFALLAVALVRWPKVGLAVMAAALVVLGVAFALPSGVHLFGDAVVIARDAVRLPLLGESAITLNPIWAPARGALFTTQTFGIAMWTIAAAAIALAFLRERTRPQRAIAIYAVLAFAFVFALFGLTVAGAYAVNQTALSRIVMQVLPLALCAVTPVFARILAREPVSRAA